MQTAENRFADDSRPAAAVLPIAGGWRLSQGMMWTRHVVEVHVLTQQPTQMPLVAHDYVVEALAAQCANNALGDRICLGRAKRGADRLDSDPARARDEVPTQRRIAIADEKPWLLAPGRRFTDLLPDSSGGGVSRDVPIEEGATVVRNHEKDVERAERKRLHGEEVARPDLRGVEPEEGAPTRRRRWARSVALDGAAADGEPQLMEFSLDPARSPGRVLATDSLNQGDHGRAVAGPAPSGRPTLAPPVDPPSRPLPAHYGVRLDYDEVASPRLPASGEARPEAAVRSGEGRPMPAALEDRQLLPQDEVL